MNDHLATTGLRAFVLPDVRVTGRVIGTGAYGSVEAVEIPGAVCAAKKIHTVFQDRSEISAAELRRSEGLFVKECQLMSTLRHPHIVQFLGVCFLPGARLPALVMELLLTSLHDLLDPDTGTEPQPPPFFPLSLKLSILRDVARGLAFFHERAKPIIHRDLSARNVLLNSAMVAKIADMGVARIVPRLQPATMTKAPGAFVYMPPEALEDLSRYDVTIDIFSLGVLALFTLSHTFPCELLAPTYTDEATEELRARSEVDRRGRYMNIVYRQFCRDHPLVCMIRLCLNNKSKERPSIAVVGKLLERARAETRDEVCDMNKLELVQMVQKKEEEVQSLLGRVKTLDRERRDNAPPPLPPKPGHGPPRTTEELVMMQKGKPAHSVRAKSGPIRERPARQAWKGEKGDKEDNYPYINFITESDFPSPLVVARYTYQAQSSDELSFEKGETLVITCYNLQFKEKEGKTYVISNNGNGKLLLCTSREKRDGWMLAVSTKPGRENDGEKLVYHSYFGSVGTLAAHSWYQPGTNRLRADSQLKSPGLPCGCYLVRRSGKETGKASNLYTLSYLKSRREIYHCRIVHDPVTLEWSVGEFNSGQKNLQDVLALLQQSPEAINLTVPYPFIQSNHNSPSVANMECEQGAISFNERVKRGQLGEVWKGTFCGHKQVIIRTFNSDVINRETFQAVADRLWSLRHSSLLRLLAICTLAEPYCCVTELVPATVSLCRYISVRYQQMDYQGVKKRFDEDITKIVLKILHAMCYLEEKMITHGNLGVWNILIGENRTVKLSDYGLLSSINPQPFQSTVTTFCQWAAPEVLRGGSISLKSDIWSFGVLLYDLATPERQGTCDPPHGPYGNSMDRDTLLEQLETGFRLPRPSSCPQLIYSLMQSCWLQEPAERPTFVDLHSSLAPTKA